MHHQILLFVAHLHHAYPVVYVCVLHSFLSSLMQRRRRLKHKNCLIIKHISSSSAFSPLSHSLIQQAASNTMILILCHTPLAEYSDIKVALACDQTMDRPSVTFHLYVSLFLNTSLYVAAYIFTTSMTESFLYLISLFVTRKWNDLQAIQT